MNWTDIGIVLSARKHGEGASIVSLLTEEHGRHAGLVKGGSGKRARGIYEPGNLVSATWKARLEEHLGTFTCELTKAHAALVLDDQIRLAVLSAACAVTEVALPEREPHPALYESLTALLGRLAAEDWLAHYVVWELDLLRELGFGLDLTSCVATGQLEELIYVSPKSGQAVSIGAGEPYKNKLLRLPLFLMDGTVAIENTDIEAGLVLTGYFLDRHVFIHSRTGAPPARTRLIDRVIQLSTISGS